MIFNIARGVNRAATEALQSFKMINKMPFIFEVFQFFIH
ncbi:hypothetical protein NIASO_18900 [Niabella soli DSM 19437]|uniref:Uncharacterized protein n=1 Tax=Niabella soli DSM 19437 TaxID=929713 RepID=W0F874_9BACT|nr:hypothetical protein NIASO_18900 [Niabella soli DSM 19437]